LSAPIPPTRPGGAYAPAVTQAPAHRAPGEPTAGYDVGDVSVGDLISNVTRDLSTLMRQELALAQAEIKQEVSKAAKGAGALSGAGVAGYFVVLFLSLALWAGLSNVMDAGWAGLIVAVIWAVIAAVLFSVGRSKMREVNPKPERTVDTLSHVPDALKGQRGVTP
jgi:putative superfamily III holin-X